MEITQERKDAIEGQIVDIIADSLEKGELKEEDLQPIGQYVLDHIDTIKTEEEMSQLLADMNTKWAIFRNLSIIEKGQVKEDKEKIVAREVLEEVQEGNIEKAIDLAKGMTDSSV